MQKKSAVSLYESIGRATLSGRSMEAFVLTRAAGLLKSCQDNWSDPVDEETLSHALNFNQRLWTFFQAELGAPNHPMPVEMRQDLLQLINFIDQRTFEILADPQCDKLEILININRNVAAGLEGLDPEGAPET